MGFPSARSSGVQPRASEFARKSFYTVINPTFGTGIASTDAATAHSDTTGLIHLYNGDTTGQVWFELNHLFLRATAVNTSATSSHLEIITDTGNRYTSGGSVLSTTPGWKCTSWAGNPNVQVDTASELLCHMGVLLLVGQTAAAKIISRQQINDVICAADDTIHVTFGEAISPFTATVFKSLSFPPIWIGPGASCVISDLNPSQAADPAYEVELGAIRWS